MTREEHLRAIYVIASQRRGKRAGLLMLCSGPDCAGAEVFALSHTVGAVLEAAARHIDEMGEGGGIG